MSTQTIEDPFPLAECTPDDIPEMLSVYFAAFGPSVANTLLFPGEVKNSDKTKAWFASRTLSQFSQPEYHLYKITDAATGEIAAYVRWGFPHVRPVKKDEVKDKDSHKVIENSWPEGTNLGLAAAKFDELDVWREKYIDWENTYVAYLLATSPKYQRRGLGTRLLRFVLDRADREGKKAYIEATPEGFPVYHRLGFREIDRMDVALHQYGGKEGEVVSNVCMMRDIGGVV